ncbi:MAG: hypothetical protein ACOCXA_06425, partial [Planctomycetota bacterium]
MAMALWNEPLTAAAGGRSCNPDLPNRQNLHLFAIRADCLGDGAAYQTEVERLRQLLLSAEPAPDGAPVRLPGL